MILRWHGHTSFLESLYIVPGGFGNGIALSAMFVALTAGIEHCEISIASALLQSTLRKQLRISLEGIDGMQDVSLPLTFGSANTD
jgi:hypothetical protein